jgi:hypothetical protein
MSHGSAGPPELPLPLENGTIGGANPQVSEPMRSSNDHDLCDRCQHLMDPHVVVATGEALEDGGIILCPEPACSCWASWCPPGMDSADIRIPDLMETDELRRTIQHL